jgi:DNA-nicking Smr family endonuclease
VSHGKTGGGDAGGAGGTGGTGDAGDEPKPRPHLLSTHDFGELKKLWRKHHQERLRQARLAQERAQAEAAEAAERALLAERRELTPQDRELFARSVGPVVPLTAPPRADTGRPQPQPEPRQRLLDEARVLHDALSDEFDPMTLLETDDELAWRRDGIGVGVMVKLRGGAWVVQGQIDLHGRTRDEARIALGEFLQHAGKQGWRCVRVVHGKGLGSPGRQPVLKAKVRTWLAQRDEVLAFTQARGADGGAGAVIVLLDSSRRTSVAAAAAPGY